MRRLFPILLSAVLAAPGCALSAAEGPVTKATKLGVRPPAFDDVEVIVAKSLPPSFELALNREMPTPGWSFVVDGVMVDEQAHRIVARVSEVPPEGVTSQVLTPAKCRIELGKVAPGTYLLEVWTRRGTSGEHRLTQAFVLVASS